VDYLSYDENVAELIAQNIDADDFTSQAFHVKSLEIDLGPERFEATVNFHNAVIVND
jgi:hypothetical protein